MTKGAPIWFRKVTRRGGFDVPGQYVRPSADRWIVKLTEKGATVMVAVNPARVRPREEVRA